MKTKPNSHRILPTVLLGSVLLALPVATQGATVVGQIAFNTVAATSTDFNTTYGFTTAAGTSTMAVPTAGWAVRSSGSNWTLVYGTTLSGTSFSTAGDVVVSFRYSAGPGSSTFANNVGIRFFDPAGLTTANQSTAVDSVMGLLGINFGSGGDDGFRFYKDGAPNSSGWLGTQITTDITGTGGTFGTAGSTGNVYYSPTSANLGVSADGAETWADVTFTYSQANNTLMGNINGLAATWTIPLADRLAVSNVGIGLHVRTDGRFDDFQINAIPEPSAFALLGMASFGLFLIRRRRSHA